jgi:hypothetical protein
LQDSPGDIEDPLSFVLYRVMQHLQTLCEALISNLPLVEEIARDSSHLFSSHIKKFETCVAHISNLCSMSSDTEDSRKHPDDSPMIRHGSAKHELSQASRAISAAELYSMELSISEIVAHYHVCFFFCRSRGNILSEHLRYRTYLNYSQARLHRM